MPDSKPVQTCGTPLAEAAFMFGVRQEMTIDALKPSACLVLQKADFTLVARDFPEAADTIYTNTKQRLRQMEKFDVLEAIEKQNVKPKKQMANLCDLLFACQSGDLTVVQEAISVNNVSIAETDFEGRSSLHIAASAGQLGVAKWLLDANIGVNKRDAVGKTALENALNHSHIEMVKLLREYGALLAWDTAEEGYQLCDAVRLGLLAKLKMLLDCGVRADSPSFDQRCALHHAAAEGNIKATELLLSYKAKVNARDRWAGTPLRDAVRGGHSKLALMLRKAGGTLGYGEVEAAGELCEQAKGSNLQGIKLLLDCGLDYNAADCELVPFELREPRLISSFCLSSL